jgi:hypothetical protein
MTIDSRLLPPNLLRKGSSKMFEFITKTWNPIRFCSHNCTYGWCHRYHLDKEPVIRENQFDKRFGKDDFVFVCDLGDLFCGGMPDNMIDLILHKLTKSQPDAKYLFMTKNPQRYYRFITELPKNAYLGCTIESNRDYPLISSAPPQSKRLHTLKTLSELGITTFIAIEPILDFDLLPFIMVINGIDPWAVAIGYDNYHHHLPEPSLTKTVNLELSIRTKVYEKTLRKAWWEK